MHQMIQSVRHRLLLGVIVLMWVMPAFAIAQEPAAVTTGRKLIDANAESICLLTYNPASYTYIKNEFKGHKQLADGSHVLNYHFHLQGSIYKRYAILEFYFDKNGQLSHIEGSKGTAIWEPWDVLAAYTTACKTSIKAIPTIANDVQMLKKVDEANQKTLCEFALKNGIKLK